MATFPSKVNYATGDILTATNMNDVGGAINLLDGAQFAAGKNAIINGDFGIWQRGTTFTNVTSAFYTADRFSVTSANSTIDVTRSTFTPGTAPVAGYEGQFFATVGIEATDTDARFNQNMEDVRTFAGQTVTVSFWAKSNVTTDALRFVRLQQVFGSGGSSVVNTDSSPITLTSSWARYTATIAVPSITGKTIGTNSYLALQLCFKASTAQTFDVWGVQVEAASTASNFQTATGTNQGELAACQRYYNRIATGDGKSISQAFAFSTTSVRSVIVLPTTMRTTPSLDTITGTNYYLSIVNGGNLGINTLTILGDSTSTVVHFGGTLTGAVAGYGSYLYTNNAAAYFGLSAEL